jgi:NADPH:quinone reductase-like Zn-dependent oxidoreductase
VLRYEEAPRPIAGNGEVLVEVHAAAVTPGELSWDASWIRNDGTDRTPMIPSHEFSGVVVSTAAGVDDVRVGDEVYGLIDFHRDGAAAEWVGLPHDVVVGRPLVLSHVESAALPLAALTAWQALTRHGHVQRGDRVFIQGGAGGVGSLAVQLAKSIGATVSATATPEDQPLLRSLGADAVVESPDAALASGEPGFDVLLNTFRGPVPAKSYDLVRSGGRLVTLAEPFDKAETTSRGIEGIFFVVESDTADLRRIAMLAERGALRPVIARTFPLSEASEAYGPSPSPARPGKTVLVVRP